MHPPNRSASGKWISALAHPALTIVLGFLLLRALTSTAYGYNTGDGPSADEVHQWITEKAVQFLLEKSDGVAKLYPLEDFLQDLKFGVWVADHSGIDCNWRILWGAYEWTKDCDSIHHYGGGRHNKIYTWGANVVADMGELSAEVYCRSLYELAVKFWPGGESPRLDELRYVDAGETNVLHDTTSLMNAYVGGWPLCELYFSNLHGDEARGKAECPKWPWWTSGAEGVDSAMRYLGWALHMIQDLTVYYHVVGLATRDHESWENDVSVLVKAGRFEHLPGQYRYCLDAEQCRLRMYCKDPGANPNDCELWDVMADMDILAEILSFEQFVTYIVDTGSLAIEGKYPESALETKELRLDFAIRASAAVVEKFFREVAPPREDQFEENDSAAGARTLAPGSYPARYAGLTVFPGDEDFYKFYVESDGSDVVVDVLWEAPGRPAMPWLNALLSVPGPYGGFNVLGTRTSYGTRMEVKGGGAGYYSLEIWSTVPLGYDLVLSVSRGALPADAYDRVARNDTPETASKVRRLLEAPVACEERLNIDRVGDEDHYEFSLPAGTWWVEVSIAYDPGAGGVRVWLNGEEARIGVVREDGSVLREISKCLSVGPAAVKVAGAQNYYDLCVKRFEDSGCLGAPRIRVSPGSCFFGGYAVGETSPYQTVTISNEGTADLRIAGMNLSDDANFRLNVGRGSCGSAALSLKPGESCTVAVQFTPQRAQAKIRESLTILSDDPMSPASQVFLYGSSVLLTMSGSSMLACDSEERFVVSGGTPPYTFSFLLCSRLTTPWGAPGPEVCSFSFSFPSNMLVESGENFVSLKVVGCVPEWLTHLFVRITDSRGIYTEREIVFLPGTSARFQRGDANVDGAIDISDAIATLGFLFLGNPSALACEKAADADDNGALEISDAVYLLGFEFLGGWPPPPPYPMCGFDATEDLLTCESFEGCP